MTLYSSKTNNGQSGTEGIAVLSTRHNYYSFKPDPQALATDALTQDWRENRPYMFPPFILLGPTLITDRVEEAVLIAPKWPFQTWYPLRLQTLVGVTVNRSISQGPQNVINFLKTFWASFQSLESSGFH